MWFQEWCAVWSSVCCSLLFCCCVVLPASAASSSHDHMLDTACVQRIFDYVAKGFKGQGVGGLRLVTNDLWFPQDT